ncbi:MAG: hypothetical protein QM668_22840 [Agriterribacter sp.]
MDANQWLMISLVQVYQGGLPEAVLLNIILLVSKEYSDVKQVQSPGVRQ